MLRKLLWSAAVIALLAFTAVTLYPRAPVVVPATLPAAERSDHRHLEFQGIANFRDLGGYTTEDGRQVRWGSLYRSGQLSDATGRDREDLAGLGLYKLIDFRSRQEREDEPSALPSPTEFRVVELPVLEDENLPQVLAERINTNNFAGFRVDDVMIEANRQFVLNHTPEFSGFMVHVLEAEGRPVLWHCTGGKDRTGFAAAILLRALGVPQDTVMQDYLLSEQYSVEAHRKDLLLLKVLKSDQAAEVVRELLGVKPGWLQAAFDTIDEEYGSFDNYLLEGLGLGPDDIAELKSHLLE